MRRGVGLTRFIVLLLFLFVASYMGFYIFNAMYDPFVAIEAIPVEAEDVLPLSGYVVRDEMRLDPIDGIVEIMPYEGKRIARDEVIAVIYEDERALNLKIEADELRVRIEQLEYSKRDYANLIDISKLDNGIYEQLTDLCESDDTRSLDELHERSLSLKNLIFKREYTFGEIESIDAILDGLYDKLDNLSGAGGGGATRVNSPAPGIYSGVTDGFEDILTPETIKSLTPEWLDSLSAMKVTAPASSGKLVHGYRWYYAANVPAAAAENMVPGNTVTIRFYKSSLREHTLTVDYISKPENGDCAVIFSSTRFLSDIIRLRRVLAEIILNTYSGIRVPKEAIRVREGITGVFCIVGFETRFKEIDIIYEKDNYYIISEDTANKDALRLGDEIVVKGRDLEDGKVVR